MEVIGIERDAWADFLCEGGIVTQGSARNHSRYIIKLISKSVSPFFIFCIANDTKYRQELIYFLWEIVYDSDRFIRVSENKIKRRRNYEKNTQMRGVDRAALHDPGSDAVIARHGPCGIRRRFGGDQRHGLRC
jgi:hypothetical protein